MIGSKDFFFLGDSVMTEIGEISFIKLKDYPNYVHYLNAIKMSKKEIIREYEKLNEAENLNELIIELKRNSLFNIVNHILPDFSEAYHKVLEKIFVDKERLSEINPNNFNSLRKLVLDMHCLSEEKISTNEEIQEFDDLAKRLKQQDSHNDLKDIVSCVAAFNGYTYNEIADMTVYQLQLSFYRMAEIMNYNTTTLFATVSSEAKINDWSKSIDLYKEDSYHLNAKEAKNLEKLFGD
ncbi:hypothetical protein [Bacillus altitudinis]|uniref:hypothetical protein n=1 Tax=Bacillus altitudinis TaxID=293387 RepID=UPI001BD021DE|nr:hypothetical protein [Bacillus altitudinis]MBS4747535.1 hypothetical protein [Bacillus altitudinis]